MVFGLFGWSALAQAAVFGTPDQDRVVRALREQFTQALPTYPASGWNFGENWICQTHNAFRDDFYGEPDATLRLQATGQPNVLESSGNMIFKVVTITDQGLQSTQENEAYGNEPLFMTIRPKFTYSNRRRGKGASAVSAVRLIGEVSVNPSILKSLANYYGYATAFRGVPSVVDPSKVVYYYFSCVPASDRATDRAEARSRTWSIPAELSRQWQP